MLKCQYQRSHGGDPNNTVPFGLTHAFLHKTENKFVRPVNKRRSSMLVKEDLQMPSALFNVHSVDGSLGEIMASIVYGLI
jgi:hypothetical protein